MEGRGVGNSGNPDAASAVGESSSEAGPDGGEEAVDVLPDGGVSDGRPDRPQRPPLHQVEGRPLPQRVSTQNLTFECFVCLNMELFLSRPLPDPAPPSTPANSAFLNGLPPTNRILYM